jgi:two-component system, OmpR family, sensor histidine kinase SenX3
MLTTSLCQPASQPLGSNRLSVPPVGPIGTASVASDRPDSLAMLAHDIRGPLANLAMLVEAIGENATPRGIDKITGQAAKAGRIIDRLEGMITSMLERLRLNGDVLRPTNALVDLADLVETVATLNRPLAERRMVRLHCIIADPLRATGDAHLLMQAIDNLLGNAITLTPRHGMVLCEAAPGDDGDVLVRVADQGPGLSKEDIAALFRPFSSVQRHSNQKRRSTGLGLYIVRQIAEAHRGSVEVQSDGLAKGSCFLLRLPGLSRQA